MKIIKRDKLVKSKKKNKRRPIYLTMCIVALIWKSNFVHVWLMLNELDRTISSWLNI